MGCNKWIPENEIEYEFEKNRASFDKLIEAGNRGIRGLVDVRHCKNCNDNRNQVYIEVQPVSEVFWKAKSNKHSKPESDNQNTELYIIPSKQQSQNRFDS